MNVNIHKDDFIFEYEKEAVMPYEALDKVSDGTDVKSKLDYLAELNQMIKKNRFVHLFKVGSNPSKLSSHDSVLEIILETSVSRTLSCFS